MQVKAYMRQLGRGARAAARELARADTAAKDRALARMVENGLIEASSLKESGRTQNEVVKSDAPCSRLSGRSTVFAFEPPERFVAGTVGEPGDRVLDLQLSSLGSGGC